MLVFSSAEITNSTIERFPLPEASLEIEDVSGFASEIGIAWKDPTAVLPGTNGSGVTRRDSFPLQLIEPSD